VCLRRTQLKIIIYVKQYDLQTHHAPKIGCDPRTLARKAAPGLVRAVGILLDGTLIFDPAHAEANRQALIAEEIGSVRTFQTHPTPGYMLEK
jgi:hypothetical protein